MGRRTALACAVLLGLGFVACDDGSSGGTERVDVTTTIDESPTGPAAAVDTVDPAPPAMATDPAMPDTEFAPVGQPMGWTLVSSMSGALQQPVTWSSGFAAINDPADDAQIIDDMASEIWFSPDGIEWAPAPNAPPGDVLALAGQHGDLFALIGDIFDNTGPQTLWHLRAGEPWEEILTHEMLDLIAVGPERLIAYSHGKFDILAVYDTTTLAPVEFNGLPNVDIQPTEQVADLEEFLGTLLYQGRVIALDEGFIASVGWLVSLSPDEIDWRILYSADGSTWIEHPTADAETVVIPYNESGTTTFDGLNLLTAEGVTVPAGGAWVTDTGLDLEAVPDTTIDNVSGTDAGFFSIVDGVLRHSMDGVAWETLEAPPNWSLLAGIDHRGFAGGTIVSTDEALLAIGVHGAIEGFVGLVEPTTDIWMASI